VVRYSCSYGFIFCGVFCNVLIVSMRFFVVYLFFRVVFMDVHDIFSILPQYP
jgi:hypothetical protein